MNKIYPKKRLLMGLLLAMLGSQTFAQNSEKAHFTFVNVADSTQGFSGLSKFPAINDGGAVAFVASGSDKKQGVFRWQESEIATIASESDGLLTSFGDDVVINATGVVGYDANLIAGVNERVIRTSDGVSTKTIVDTNQQGLIGRFLGSPSINSSAQVAFFAERQNRSLAVFVGNGETLTVVADTTDSNFRTFGDAAINNSGEVVFLGFLKDFSPGVFVATAAKDHTNSGDDTAAPIIIVADPSSPAFSDTGVSFEDPVINARGIVADVAFLSNGNLSVFTGNGRGLMLRTDPNSPFLTNSEHPSINNSGAVAFSADEAGGARGMFVELSGGASAVAILQTGDPLFGSTVTSVSVGRFALSDSLRLVFEYELQDGRSGIAVASLRGRSGAEPDRENDDER
jgi:hypothetical protein